MRTPLSFRHPRLIIAGIATCPLLVLAAPVADASPTVSATASSSAAASPSAGGTPQKVIVLLRDQHAGTPATRAKAAARASADATTQAPVISSLKASGAKGLRSYQTIDAVAATVSPAEKTTLEANPAVAEVVPDATIQLASPVAAEKSAVAATGGNAAPSSVCSTTTPQLNPEALADTHTDSDVPGAQTARSFGITGKGVSVAYIAEGIDINNPDFIRADGSHVFSDYQDFSGDGPNAPTTGGEAFLDASSIAAQGLHTYDVANFGPNAVKTPCKIRVEGVAPGASLVGLKVFAENNITTESDFLQAIDYAVFTDHVDVLNESFGSNPFPDSVNDVTRIFDEQAVAAGTTVTASSGDSGVTSTIGSPASDAGVISVGASTTYRINLQDGYAGANLPGVTGYLDNNISSLSSGGTTEAGRTADLVAPGELNWVVCTPDLTFYSECTNFFGQASPVVESGGTSESAPLTAGAAALVIEAYRKYHNGDSPTPAQVKDIIVSTADDINAPADQQGAGLLDSYQAVRAAILAPGTTKPRVDASTLVTPTSADGGDQINASAAPGTRLVNSVEVTNIGGKPETLSAAPRRLGSYSTVASTTVTLSDTTSAHYPDYAGNQTDNVEKVTFAVPSGVDRLDANIAYTSPSPVSSDPHNVAAATRVRITLVDPTGKLASYSLPQGAGNYGDSQVTSPAAGTWIAYVYSHSSATGGTLGPVRFRARVANYNSPGRVSPSTLTLAPGQAGTFTYTASTPSTPGDSATSLVISPSAGGVGTTVPVILRSVLPVTKRAQSFRDTLTGGNGRATNTGQTFYYQLNVPAGLSALNASIALKDNPLSTFTATLVDPNGDAVGTGGNTLTSTDNDGAISVTQQLAGVVHTLNPTPGTWDLIVNFYNQVQGDRLQTPFTVSVDGRPAKVSASAPTSALKVPAGTSTTAAIRVTNTTPATEEYFVDARLNTVVNLPLAVATATTSLPLNPKVGGPTFTVPTHTTSLTVAASGTQNLTFDAGYAFGDPDLAALSEGHYATLTYNANPVVQGSWFALPSEFGPYTDAGPAAGTQTTTASVKTLAFDSGVTSGTGDLWLQATDPKATLTPVIVPPGATTTIPVTITASKTAAPGSVVSGTLYLGDYGLVNEGFVGADGNDIAAVPYSYTVAKAPKAPKATTGSGTTSTGSAPKSGAPAVLTPAAHYAAELRMLARSKAAHFAAELRMLARTRAAAAKK